MVFHSLADHIQKYRIIAGILDGKPASGPYSVHLDLTNKCNNNCIACWSYSPLIRMRTVKKDAIGKEIPYEKVLNLVDELASLGVREIYLTGGGEPFMHPKAIEIIQYIKKKKIRCDMSTNFTLIDKKMAEQLVKAKVDHMNCSIWAGSPAAYAKTHPNKNEETFRKIKEMLLFIHKLKTKYNSNRPKITLYNVISSANYDDFENMVEFAYSVKANSAAFTPADIVPGFTDWLMLNRKMQASLKQKFNSISGRIPELERKYHHRLELQEFDQFSRRISGDNAGKGFYDRSIIATMPCYAGYTFLRILATGEVDSCLKSGRIPIGSIYKNTIKELWQSKRQQEFRKHTLSYDTNDPFFNNIGNTTQKGNGCMYCCDNLGWNLIFDREIKKISPAGKKIVRLAKLL